MLQTHRGAHYLGGENRHEIMFCDKSGERGDVLGGSGVVRPVKQVHCACVGFIVIGEVSRGMGELRDEALRRCRFQSSQISKRSGLGNCEGSIELGLTVQSISQK